jgi:lipoprotein-anchoring transpeptidase ErfK/SrfK
MLKRRPDLPRHMPGGLDNPLGARAIYLGSSMYRIHGSNEPDTIGAAVSSGCIRMTNQDVTDLFERVKLGTKVVVLQQSAQH